MSSDNPLTEKKRVLPVRDEEVPFSFDELFFSRTDARGAILFGNGVFQRISQYSWDELLNKPHSIIRHPDMPRAVFWLLWRTIQMGEPIGAYVKNRAKDGRFYWVFAVVTPLENGYLSVRLKPSVQVAAIEHEYRSLVSLALSSDHSPEQSAEFLLSRLATLGFRDYQAFMSEALSCEVKARDAVLGRSPDATIECFDRLVESAKTVIDQAEKIHLVYDQCRYAPLNLRIQAAQLGDKGGTVDVISGNYGTIAGEIQGKVSQFLDSARGVLSTIYKGLFLTCTASLQKEVAELFEAEGEADQTEQQAGIERGLQERLLTQQIVAYRAMALEGLHAITQQCSRFQEDCADVRRLTTNLEVVRLMGKMESSRLIGLNEGLDKLISDLEASQATITTGLKQIEQVNRDIRFNLGRTIEHASCAV